MKAIVLFLILLTGPIASAEEKDTFYMSLSTNTYTYLNHNSEEFDASSSFKFNSIRVGVGRTILNNLEIELNHRKFYNLLLNHSRDYLDIKQQTVKYLFTNRINIATTEFNVYLKLHRFNKLVTYLQYGTGLANVSSDDIKLVIKQVDLRDLYKTFAKGVKLNDKNLFNSIGLETRYAINHRLQINVLSCRFMNLGNTKNNYIGIDKVLLSTVKISDISTGIIFKF